MNRLHRLLAAAATACLAHGADILFIGNSFTFGGNEKPVEELGGVPAMVAEIARAGGKNVRVHMLAEPGKDWAFHLRRPETATTLREREWTHVVLQDFSTRPTEIGNAAAFRRDGGRFYRLVRRTAPRAEIVLFQTWARGAGHEMYPGDFAHPDEMRRQLLRGYADLEQRLEALEDGEQVSRAPVGTAFALHLVAFPDDRVHGADRYHASEEGSYLAALVIAGTIFGDIDLAEAPHRFGALVIHPAAAARLKQTAESVTRNPQAASGSPAYLTPPSRVVSVPPVPRTPADSHHD